MLKRKSVLLSLAALALLAGYVLVFPPRSVQGTDLASCPMVLAGLPGTEIGLDQTVLDDLDPDDYLVRRYTRPDGDPVWLTIIYFQNARLGAHDPQLCYRSQGFRVEDLPDGVQQTAIGRISFKSFLAEKGPRHELVRYFWYAAGGETLSEVKSWRDRMFFQGLRRNRSFGAFVRISTTEGEDPADAGRALDRVVADLAPRLPGFFPEEDRPKEGERG